ncbi:MAG: phage tail protein, partial [Ruminococcus sp.]|nr:phage tail protein [Ruminococcus sp.]
MYEIRLNKAILHVSDVNSESRLSAGKIVEEVNQIPSFSFTIPPVNPLFSSELNDRKDIISVKNILTGKTEFEGVLMFHEQSMDSSGKLCIKASAEGFLGYLCDSIQLYRHYENTTAVDFLTALLEVHNSQVSAEKRLYLGICNIANADYTGSKTTSYRTTLEEIRVNLIERIGGEIQVRKVGDKLYLDYLERIGMESSTAVELAENMKSLDVKTDSANIITRLIPLGTQINDETTERLTIASINDGKPYIDDENAVEKYGIIVGTVEFDDITLPKNLLESAEKYLTKNNRILKSYEAQILDLSVLYSSHQSIECGNTYTFKNAFFGLDEPLRIMKKTTDIYKPYSPVVQIGDKTESITDIAVNQAKLIEYKLPEQKIDILTSAKETATNLIKSGFNGYVVANENEICIMDTNDKNTAQKVWRWNENGFGFSNTGYNGTYGPAMTMDGKIVADFITAGILRGIEISNGDGTFHVSPDGKVTASAMNITGGTINIHAENGINDVISLNHGNNHLHITPSFFRIINPDRNAVQIDGNIIRGYSYFWEGEFTQTFTLSSVTGDFVTDGDMSGKELYYFYN